MKNLMLFAPNPIDATSFYRAMGPMQDLKRQNNDFTITGSPEVSWSTLKAADAVFMQRPYGANHVQIMEMAKDNNKKVWLDLDDNLFEVPRSNRTWKLYRKPDVRANMVKMLMMADVVTVSTQGLKDYLEYFKVSETERISLNENIIVVPNAYDDHLYRKYRKVETPKRNPLICWRGSDTHQKDLMAFTQAMIEVAGQHLDWTWNFIGDSFWYTTEAFSTVKGLKDENIIEVESIDPIQYFKFIYGIAPAVQIVPLWDCLFNRSKSNIAWLEGNHAGAVCLGPNWSEWRLPGVINYNNPEHFGEILNDCINGQYDLEHTYKEGRDYIMQTLTLSKVNKKRREILNYLWE